MIDVYSFFEELRAHNGAIWLEEGAIKLTVPKLLQNEDVRRFISANQDRLKSVLVNNVVRSKQAFLKTRIFKSVGAPRFPLSFAQQRMWFIEQYEQGSNAYHSPTVLELVESSKVDALKFALSQIVARHDVLRTTIHYEQDPGAYQVIHDRPLLIEEVILEERDCEQRINQDVARPFDLSSEYPLRAKFYRVSSSATSLDTPVEKIILLIDIHHIASDGWSSEIFLSELFTYCEAFERGDTGFRLPSLEIQYKDYALWQRSYLKGIVLADQLGYWKSKLSGFQSLNFPTDFTRPSPIDYKGAREDFTLSRDLSDRLRAFAKDKKVTMQSILLSATAILLSKYTEQDDIVIGTPTANRQYFQTEGLIGFFVNMQVNRLLLHASQSFESLVKAVQKDQTVAQLHQDLPFEKLLDELNVDRNPAMHPVFQVSFVVESFGAGAQLFPPGKQYLKPFQGTIDYHVTKFDLAFSIDDSGERIRGSVTYATSLFRGETISKLIEYYAELISRLAAAPEKRYSNLSLLYGESYDKVVYKWNETNKEYNLKPTISEVFETQVSKTPENIAIIYEGQRLTFRELNEKSNQLARHIREQYNERTGNTLKPDTLVALYLEKSLEMVIAIMAVLKAGAAYIPMDPSYPQERIDYLLEDTNTSMILCQRSLEAGTVRLPSSKVVFIDLTERLYDERVIEKHNLPAHSTSTDLAYVIYTSGTSGRPKGVMIEHRSVVNLISTQEKLLEVTSASRMLQYASYVFDASVWEIFTSLLTGASLSIIPGSARQDAELIKDHLEGNRTTVALLPPSLLSAMLVGKYADLSTLVVGGEQCSLDLMRQWGMGRKLVNAYGPTENTVVASIHEYKHGDIPANIGRPLPNVKLYILDRHRVPVPVGVIGELYIGGAGVSRGYLNNPGLTAQRFVSNIFATESDKKLGYTRLYKTGDLVRWLGNGDIEYIARNDDQVKIRGYRIELAEIEHAMNQVEGVRQSYVVVKSKPGNASASKQLIGYYVKDTGSAVSDAIIIASLSRSLPEYMVPGALQCIDFFPLTINGKIDKNALPEVLVNTHADFVGSSTKTETALTAIWEKLLGLNKIGVHDNFFALGGNSIISIQVISHARKSGFDVQPKDLYQYQTIASLSARIDAKKPVDVVSTDADGLLELLPIQQWFFSEAGDNVRNFSQTLLISVEKEIKPQTIGAALNHIVRSYDALNFSYYQQNDKWFKKSIDHSIELLHEDCSRSLDFEIQTQLDRLSAKYSALLNPASGELVKAIMIRTHNTIEYNYLLLVVHQVGIDSASWPIVLQDLDSCIDQLQQKKPVELASRNRTYRHWHRSVIELSRRPTILAQADHWKEILKNAQPISKNDTEECGSTQNVYEVTLPMQLTSELLNRIHRAYQTNTSELILAALNRAVTHVLDYDRVLVGFLKEERTNNSLIPDVNIAELVGWLTTFYPVLLEKRGRDLREQITAMREQMRFGVGDGIGYGVLRHLHESTDVRDRLELKNLELLYSFIERRDSVADGKRKWVNMIWPPVFNGEEFKSRNGILLASELHGDVLTLRCKYRAERYQESFIRDLMQGVTESLHLLVAHCLEQKGTHYTRPDYHEVTFAQRYWVDRRIEASGLKDKRHDAATMALTIRGTFNIDICRGSLKYLVMRHESLRSSFVVYDGEPTLRVLHPDDLPEYFRFQDFSLSVDGLDGFVFFEDHWFDLQNGPLFLARVAQTRSDEYVLSFRLHHVIMDDWSIGVLLRDFFVAYKSLLRRHTPPMPPLYRQFKDYITDAVVAIRENYFKQKEYWLATYPTLPPEMILPFAQPRDSYDISKKVQRNMNYSLELELFEKVQRIAMDRSTSVFNVFHSTFLGYLNSRTGQTDFCIGTQRFQRDRFDIENQIGFYATTVLIRTTIDGAASIDEILERIIASDEEMSTYTTCPYSDAVYSLLPQGQIIYGNFWKVDLHYRSFPGFYVNPADFDDNDLAILTYARDVKPDEADTLIPYDIQLSLVKEENAFGLMIRYDGSAFTEHTLRRLIIDYVEYCNRSV